MRYIAVLKDNPNLFLQHYWFWSDTPDQLRVLTTPHLTNCRTFKSIAEFEWVFKIALRQANMCYNPFEVIPHPTDQAIDQALNSQD